MRLSPPRELGDDCVQPPVWLAPTGNGMGLKIHSTASAALISGLCSFRVKDTTSPSTFIPKPELSKLCLKKEHPFSLETSTEEGPFRVSAIPSLHGRCWVPQNKLWRDLGGTKQPPSQAMGTSVPSALRWCLPHTGPALEDWAHNTDGAQQSESPGWSLWARWSLISHIYGTVQNKQTKGGVTAAVRQFQWELPPEMKPFQLLPAVVLVRMNISSASPEVWWAGKKFLKASGYSWKRGKMWEAVVEWGCSENCVWAGEAGAKRSVSKDEHEPEKIRSTLQIYLNALGAGFF